MKIIVIDVNAEVSKDDIEKLERAGYLVIRITGDPHSSISILA